MKNYLKNYPRPQFIRSHWQNLNGSWDFAFDDDNVGELQKWYEDFNSQTEIQVPFTYETKLSGIQDETIHQQIWYHKTITLTQDDFHHQNIILHFEGCDYTAKLWVNGAYLGSHTGAYSRFSFDITRFAQVGENQITVRVEDSLDEQQPRGKQRWIPENYGCWYVQTTGIWKTVWLEFVPKESIEQVKITPVLDSYEVAFEFDVLAEQYGSDLLVSAEISFEGKFVNRLLLPVTKKHICGRLSVDSTDIFEWHVKTWSPEHPDLYDVTFTLIRNTETIDTVLSYFGMRDIRIEQSNVLLNHVPIYQRLILDQGYWKDSHLTPPSEEALIEDIDKIIALGYNGVRKHQKIEDERFLYWCDVKGLLVWSEMGAAYRYTDHAVQQFTSQWMEIVRQNYNHPSIIVWTPFNESWGINNVETNSMQQHFTEAIYHLTKSFDSNRPVIVNDGWEHTISDIITLHDYEELGSVFIERYNHYKDEILSTELYHCGSKSAFANGYTYRGQPILLSEFGGIAFNNDSSGWGYGNKVNSREEFIQRFDHITTAMKEIPYFCGYCYTQVTDVQQEINGLMDIDRNFKVEPETIREINERSVGLWKQAKK